MRNIICLIALLIPLGCVENQPPREALNEGYAALEQQQYDQAIGKADEFLSQQPAGPGSAEALYLRGRGYEQRVARNAQDAQVNLQNARTSYIQALDQNPPDQLEAYIRASLANVAYFQDDYATAHQQWSAAYNELSDEPDVQAWVLYRIGLCQQRTSQFEQADRAFAAVQERFPNTLPARPREHAGARSFYVQLATFANITGAEQATAQLKREGAMPVRSIDAKGRHVIRVGPAQSYAQAQSLKSRFLSRYPDAMIVP